MAAYDPYDWLIPAAQNPYKLKYGTRHIDLASESERQEAERFNAPLEAEQKRLENALEKASQPFREKLLQERLAALPAGVSCRSRQLGANADGEWHAPQQAFCAKYHRQFHEQARRYV